MRTYTGHDKQQEGEKKKRISLAAVESKEEPRRGLMVCTTHRRAASDTSTVRYAAYIHWANQATKPT